MFRLLRWLFSLVIFAIVVFFAATVELGKRTLFGHLWAILHTQEAKDLADGTKVEAKKVAERMKEEIKKDVAKDAPKEQLSDEEKQKLDKLVHEKTAEKTK